MRILFLAIGVALLGLASPPEGRGADQKVIVVAAARIETIAQGAIRDGVIIIRDGKIAEVGRALRIPEGALVIDAGEGTVIPGIVIPVSGYGLSRGASGGSRTPHYRVIDALDAYGTTYERLLAAGITTLNLVPRGGGVVGQSAAIRAGRGSREAVTLKESAALVMSIQPSTESKSILRGELEKGKKAIEARKKKEKAEKKKAEKKKAEEAKKSTGKKDEKKRAAPDDEGDKGSATGKAADEKKEKEPDPKVQPLIDFLEGNLPALIRCDSPAAAAHLLPILEPYRKDPFKARTAIVAGSDIWRAKDLLAKEKMPVILRAQVSFERYTRNRICPPAILASAGIEIALLPSSDSAEGLQNFLLAAAQMVKHGMRRDDVLRAITLTPAKILDLHDRVGSIEPGRDANLVILSGDPFHGATRIEKVLLEGEVVYRFGQRPKTSLLAPEKPKPSGKDDLAKKPADAEGKKEKEKDEPEAKKKPEKADKKEDEKKKEEPATVIVGGDIHTVSGGVIRRGTIIIRNGKIESVGSDLPVPEGAKVIDAKGLVVSPGFVAARCSGVGLWGRGSSSGKLGDALDPYSFSITLALASGITAAYVPGGSGRFGGASSDLLRGASAVIKMTKGDLDQMLVQEPASVSIRYSGASASAKFSLKERLRKAVDYARKLKDAKRKGKDGKPPKKDSGSEALLPLIRGQVPARISAGTAEDILAALELADEFGFRLVLEGAHEAWTVAEEISKRDVSLIISPRRKVRADETRARPSGSNLRLPAILRKAGVPFSIIAPRSSLVTWGVAGQDMVTLNVDAAFAVGRGLDERTALESITLNPARALGVSDRIGSIEPGKDADIILLDGDPLDFRSFVTMALVNGKVYYEKSKTPLFAPFGRSAIQTDSPDEETK